MERVTATLLASGSSLVSETGPGAAGRGSSHAVQLGCVDGLRSVQLRQTHSAPAGQTPPHLRPASKHARTYRCSCVGGSQAHHKDEVFRECFLGENKDKAVRCTRSLRRGVEALCIMPMHCLCANRAQKRIEHANASHACKAKPPDQHGKDLEEYCSSTH